MKSLDSTLDPTISEIINDSKYEELQTLPLTNPIPILQQQKSSVSTNIFIKPLSTQPILSPSPHASHSHISKNYLGFFDDLFNKPNDIHWADYFPIILKKDDRYFYLSILFLIIAVYLLIIF